MNDDDSASKAHPDRPVWAVSCGQEGTTVHLTLLRHKEEIPIALTRINIEDLQDAKYRHVWEKIISDLGYPKGGTFSGPSMDQLKLTSSDDEMLLNNK
jgi:hypothetical protein